MDDRKLAAYLARKEGLILSARVAHAEDADSYRGFCVGAAFLAENDCGDFQIFSAGNMKRPCRKKDECFCESGGEVAGRKIKRHTHKEMKPRKKCCAERRAIHKAWRAGYRHIIGGCVVGDIQVDNESGVPTELLEPCGVCRKAFKRLVRENKMANDAPIVCAHPDPKDSVGPIEQVLWQILAKHNDAE